MDGGTADAEVLGMRNAPASIHAMAASYYKTIMSISEKNGSTASGPSRRGFLQATGLAVLGGGLMGVSGCASMAGNGAMSPAIEPHNRPIEALDKIDMTDGGADPIPIPWLDKNGSHNQSPGPDMDPSNIFHFRGKVARANDFTGMGTDNAGRRLAFGSKSTDFSFMQGEYFSARQARRGAFGHI